MKRDIFVTFQLAGIHSYLNAPEQVSYLRYPHRHMFHFKVKLEVFHNNRDIEFIIFKNELISLYNTDLDINNKSCESIAEELINYIVAKYPHRGITVEVSEDGENGAILSYE